MTEVQNVNLVTSQNQTIGKEEHKKYALIPSFKAQNDSFSRQLSSQQKQQKMLEEYQKEQKRQKQQRIGRTFLNILTGAAMVAIILSCVPAIKSLIKRSNSTNKVKPKAFFEQFKDLSKEKSIVSLENESIDDTFRIFAKDVKNSFNCPKEIIDVAGDEATDNMILICGRSGYGKTYDADVLFKEIGAKRIKRQFSNWSSKYVGETAVNVTEFFNELEKLLKEFPDEKFGVVLDEADSLFTPIEKITAEHAHLKETRSAILNGIDQVRKYPNCCIVATTNAEIAAGELDEAIVRRFAHNYTIKAPNVKALRASLKTHFTGFDGIEKLFENPKIEEFLQKLNQRGAGHGDIENIARAAKTTWKSKIIELGKNAGCIDKVNTRKVLDSAKLNKIIQENPLTVENLQEAVDSLGKLAIETRKLPKSMVEQMPNKLLSAYAEANNYMEPGELEKLLDNIILAIKNKTTAG